MQFNCTIYCTKTLNIWYLTLGAWVTCGIGNAFWSNLTGLGRGVVLQVQVTGFKKIYCVANLEFVSVLQTHKGSATAEKLTRKSCG